MGPGKGRKEKTTTLMYEGDLAREKIRAKGGGQNNRGVMNHEVSPKGKGRERRQRWHEQERGMLLLGRVRAH